MSGGFLSRWSKRKLAAGGAPVRPVAEPPVTVADRAADGGLDEHADAALAVPAPAAVELPPVEALTLASDFTAFLKEEVSEAVRRQALKKLFADPHFNRMDGLDVYIDDYNIADPIPPHLMEKLKHAREWLGDAPAAEQTEAPGETLDTPAAASAAGLSEELVPEGASTPPAGEQASAAGLAEAAPAAGSAAEGQTNGAAREV